MTPAKSKLIDYLVNDFFPNIVKLNVLSCKKIEYENYYFKYYIIEFEIYQDCYDGSYPKLEDIVDDEKSYFKELYSKNFSFNTIKQDIISKEYKYKLLYPYIRKRTYIIRYSKTYKTLSCYEEIDFIKFIKSSHNHNRRKAKKTKSWTVNRFLFSKIKIKLFSLNKNDKVIMYYRQNVYPKYISLKNVYSYIKSNPEYKEVIQKLFNIHLNNNLIIPEDDTYSICNKFIDGKNSFYDVLKDINPNILNSTMINHFRVDDIVNTMNILKKEDADMFISFYKDCFDMFIKNKTKYNEIFFTASYVNIDSNSLLNFLHFYILKRKNIIQQLNENLYYSNLYKHFISDVTLYINNCFTNGSILDLNFNYHNELRYILYKSNIKIYLKNSTKLKTDDISFVSLFNESSIHPELQVVNIKNKFELKNVIFSENIFIDINNMLNSPIYFKTYIEDVAVLFTINNFGKKEYFLNIKNFNVSNNNQKLDLYNLKFKINNILSVINLPFNELVQKVQPVFNDDPFGDLPF